MKGKDPRNFAGVDLIAGLTALQAPSGRFTDRSQFGDFSNAFTQSYALFALGEDARGTAYLAGSQCPDGGFPVTFETSPGVSDVDATAIVIQALRAQGGSNANSTGLAAWVLRDRAARDFLKSLQVRTGPDAGAIAFDASGFDKANAPRATAQAVLGLTGANLATLRG